MDNFISDYYKNLKQLIDSIDVTDKNNLNLSYNEGVIKSKDAILNCSRLGSKLIFIGNGASATISSHQATDFWKNGGIRAIAFNDAALITCLSNDIGYEYVFEKSIDMFADKNDILFAISSSGKSKNILKGAEAAIKKSCKVITLSGFSKDNPLRSMGDINFYVPSPLYGHVEILHHSICHCILEYILSINNKMEG